MFLIFICLILIILFFIINIFFSTSLSLFTPMIINWWSFSIQMISVVLFLLLSCLF
jgi:hypothetical protein